MILLIGKPASTALNRCVQSARSMRSVHKQLELKRRHCVSAFLVIPPRAGQNLLHWQVKISRHISPHAMDMVGRIACGVWLDVDEFNHE